MSKAHIPPAIAIWGKLKQFCRSKFLIFPNWRDRKGRKIKEKVYSGCLCLVYTIEQPFAHVCTGFFWINMQKWATQQCHIKISIVVILFPYWILQVLKRPLTCVGLKITLSSLIMIIYVLHVQNFTVNMHSKIWPIWFSHRVMNPKDADRNSNSVDPDQTLHWLPRPVWKLRIITVIYHFIVMVTNSTTKKIRLSLRLKCQIIMLLVVK